MRRRLRRWLAGVVLSERERWHCEAQGFRQPWIRAWFRREWWGPAKQDLLGTYPRQHRYHQENPFLRFYPLAMTVLVVGGLAVVLVKWLLGS